MMNLDARSIAQALGGEVQGRDAVLAPGPGHSPKDRSLSIKLVAVAADGFIVHSHAGDDPIVCRDYVRSKIGLPVWQPSSRALAPLRSLARCSTNGAHNGSNGRPVAPLVHALPADDAIKLPTVTLPARTQPDADGKPRFMPWGDDGPPCHDEQRRHVYLRDGIPVRIKIKNPAGVPLAYKNWYRVADVDGATGWQAKKPDDYSPVPYVGMCSPFDPELIADRLYWPEGEKDVDKVTAAGGVALCFGGVGDGLPDEIERFIAGRDLVILADNDEPGRKHAARKVAIALPVAKSLRVVEFLELAEGGDVSDWFADGGTIEALHARADAAALETLAADLEPPLPDIDRSLVIRCASDIRPEPISWFWPNRIAQGKLTLIVGQPGLGKSQLTAALAAATTTGERWPCDEGTAPLGSVLILSAEDDPADTQVPRLLAAGADCRRVHIISAVREKDAKGNRTFNLAADLDLLERELERLGDVTLITIDPLSSYLGKIDSHKNSEVRGVLEMIAEMAARHRVAVVGVTHFNKGEGSAINKVIGSIAFVAAARATFMVAADPEDDTRRLFVGMKNNLGRTAGGLAFRVAQIGVGENRDILAPYIVWDADHVSDQTADQILAASNGGRDEARPANADAADFLLSVLADGPCAVETIQQEAVVAGLLKAGSTIGADKTFRLARAKLGMSKETGGVYREGGMADGGRWFWRLPPKMPQNAYDAPLPDKGILGGQGHLRDRSGQ